MANSKEDYIQEVEKFLKANSSKSYSKEQIIILLSSGNRDKQQEVEAILGEVEVWSSMKTKQSSIYSTCRDGTVYFQWGQIP
jgi:hypothetical protein